MIAVAALVLAACQPAPSDAPVTEGAAAESELSLLCDAFAHVSYDALAAAYGPQNLREQTLPGPEGESYTATVLYPDDTARRLEIIWFTDAKTAPASISVSGAGSLWRGPHNIAIGDDLQRVEAANGREFQLYGFGWDYGGLVSDWNGGQLGESNNCRVSVQFDATNEPTTGVLGDGAFASNLPEMRAAAPVVSEFGLGFSQPQE